MMQRNIAFIAFTVALFSAAGAAFPLLSSLTPEGDRRVGTVFQQPETHFSSSQRQLLQLGRPWVDNGGTWPAGFSDLDRAAETQRIFRAVVAERNKTATAARNPDQAWSDWLQQYNVTYNSTQEATFRRQVFDYNVALAQQLNVLAGPEVAFGINRFSVLTPQEFLAAYTGDAQDDSGISVDENNPVGVYSPASAVIAAMRAAADAAYNASLANGTTNGTADGNGTESGPASGTDETTDSTADDTATGDDAAQAFSVQSIPHHSNPAMHLASARSQQPQLPGALHDVNIGSALSPSRGRRRALQQQQQQNMSLWRRLLAALGWTEQLHKQQQQQRWYLPYTSPVQQHEADGSTDSSRSSSSSVKRRLQQVIQPAEPFRSSATFCSKQVAYPYTNLLPFKSVDWLRVGAVRPPKTQGNCSNSFAYVAAALAESTMLMQGYNGTATDISEEQLMECFPNSSCSRAGTVHVLLNYLACNGVAAVGSSFTDGQYGTYPSSNTGTAADYSGQCASGRFQPVVTGITGWAWVPNTEFALGQALSRTPAKVSVDASILQTYRAGYIGCNVVSRVANHAILAVGYNNQVRAGPPVPGSVQNFTFFNGSEYWMLKNSWGTLGSVDGFVYVKKGCQNATPLGMMLNRGVIPTWNQSESYRIGRLQCQNETNTNENCSKDTLLRLAGFCAGVDDFMPLPLNNSCSCSCIPT